ncbi:MAG: dTDP-4-dehydrorhamnose 3,5-epimerase [Candidatus Zixiibacteriota bacterium]
MNCIHTKFDGVFIIEPQVFKDNRGYFMECYVREKFHSLGIAADFVQDNHSLSLEKGTVRGMHYQLHPKAQSKLVRVVRGEILNVIVDIRRGSPTFGQWLNVNLSADDKRQLFIPRGFANGYCTLQPQTEVCYKVDEYYAPAFERAFRWNDPQLAIDWPVTEPVLSERDSKAPLFADAEINFEYEAM